jgi:septal ring factor EnvC (AmiA/AmiB activator)
VNETYILVGSLVLNFVMFYIICYGAGDYRRQLQRANDALRSALRTEFELARKFNEVQRELDASRTTIKSLRKSIDFATEQINQSGRITDESSELIKRMRDILKNCKTSQS